MSDPVINSDRLWDLFREMVDIYSPSGKEEELTEFIEEVCHAHGLEARLYPVDETRANIEVGASDGQGRILFLGHIDTVPAFDIEHYSLDERDGLCYGLGTADMKSGCAAMLEAFLTTAEHQGLPDGVVLSLVVGEEETGDGTQALLESHNFDYAVVAEPTNLQPCMEHYGYVEMLVRTSGYRRHAAMSDRETNAIRSMLRFLLRMEDRIDEEPETVLNIRDLHSSESGFAAPDRCTAGLDLHIPPALDAGEYAEELAAFAQSVLSQTTAADHAVDFPTVADGYRIADDGLLAQRLRALFGARGWAWAPAAFRSHSDANLLHAAGCKPLILGPGQLARAHTRDEAVAFAQVASAAQLYTDLLISL